ncbi:response regulator [Psychrobacillus sp. OK032]|uniref:response regulator n=1 Tax=Psychrobacillus sp. OK032 TaxID=1884358 RepID=UPI0008C44DD2|nr:response regulator [Psychrobacillus sp. OK032]SES36990.1 two-component system, CitB family, response regulator [Psychrobacillus sp. OK032]
MTKQIEILIVEDDKRISDIHRRFIEKLEGFKVIGSAYTGEEAKDWIISYMPDLILLDVYLPDTLGTDLLTIIQEHSPDTDIIFITAAAESEIVKKAFRGGVADYILKPLTFEKFKESLLSYKMKRDILTGTGKVQEDLIKSLWNNTSSVSNSEDTPPKGIDPITKEKVVNHIKKVNDGITAEALGVEVGVSRSTARRYLEYLASEKLVYAELIYGTVGRPERRYFIHLS